MSSSNSEHESTEQEHHGEGHGIPSFLKLVYVVFISWAIYYVVSYSIPNLSTWLAK